ncbi:hypothetical protein YC2023_015905 [Brassica napus]
MVCTALVSERNTAGANSSQNQETFPCVLTEFEVPIKEIITSERYDVSPSQFFWTHQTLSNLNFCI